MKIIKKNYITWKQWDNWCGAYSVTICGINVDSQILNNHGSKEEIMCHMENLAVDFVDGIDQSTVENIVDEYQC